MGNNTSGYTSGGTNVNRGDTDGNTDHYAINRVDGYGRSVYLHDRRPTAPTAIVTGAPGAGKSYVLGRAADAASSNGDVVLKLDSSQREPLENRLARAVHDQYNELARSQGTAVLRDLGRIVDKMIGDKHHWAERALTAMAPLLQKVISRLEDSPLPSVIDLLDKLGELAEEQHKRVLLVVDNLDSANSRDIATVSDLTEHLQASGRPVQLAVGATGPAVDALLSAGSPDGLPQLGDRYDIRECGPIPTGELKSALLARLDRQGATVQPDAVTPLVQEANGDPGRLLTLADHAVSSAKPPHGVDRAAAARAIQVRRDSDQWVYRTIWSGLSDEARVVVAQAANRVRGLTVKNLTRAATPESWLRQGQSIGRLVDAGVLRRDSDRLMIADPGFRQWIKINTAPLPKADRPARSAPRPARSAQKPARSAQKPARSAPRTTPTGQHRRVAQRAGAGRG